MGPVAMAEKFLMVIAGVSCFLFLFLLLRGC
jgi:hypothetical protein